MSMWSYIQVLILFFRDAVDFICRMLFFFPFYFSPLLHLLFKLSSGLLQVFAERLVSQLPWRR